VRTRVRIGELEAHGQAVAAQNGALGQEIILIAESKRRLRGRVIGEREVEVLHEK
jgi:flagella basal body P-ring formation protein FlgA